MRSGKAGLRRWSALAAGLAFSVCLVVTVIIGGAPDTHSTIAETLDHYRDGGNKTVGFIALVLSAIAVLALIGFLKELGNHVRRVDPQDNAPLGLVLASGVLATTMTLAFALRAAPIGDLLMDSEKRQGGTNKLTPEFADFARTTSSLFDWTLFFGVGIGAAAVAIAASLASRSTHALPRWLEWTGYAISPLLAFFAFFNLVLLIAWVIAVGIVIGRRAGNE
jgi:hypothetical protein